MSEDGLWWLRSVKIKHYILQKVNRASSHKEGGTEEAEVGGWQQNEEEYDVETEHIVEYKKGPNNAWKAQGRPQQATLFLVSKYFVWKNCIQDDIIIHSGYQRLPLYDAVIGTFGYCSICSDWATVEF